MTPSQTYELVSRLLSTRAGRFSPIEKIFQPYREQLAAAVGLPDGELSEIIFNALHFLHGRGACLVCGAPTRLYPQRGGWAMYCSRRCMNDARSPRHQQAEATRKLNDTSIASPQIREKIQQTLFTNYGVANPSLSETIRKKRELTFLQKYGENTPLKNEVVKKKIQKTLLERYGGCGNRSAKLNKKITLSRRKKIIEFIREKHPDWEILTELSAWQGCHAEPLLLRHRPCGLEKSDWVWTGKNLFAPICGRCHTSQPQLQVIKVLEQARVKFNVNDRSTIKPLELDVVVPDKGLAIEINGLYFHGERSGKTRLYHLSKTLQAAEKGFQLIHLTDHEVLQRRTAVETMLLSKLGLLPRIYARETCVEKINRDEADSFLEKYHMQGACRARIRLGLRHRGELVAVMTFGKPRYNKRFEWELLRFSTSKAVVGGASKLISSFRKEHPGSIISYADRRWSTGEMYRKIGFELDGETLPSYWYFNQSGELHHRSKFQRQRLGGPAGKSEKELMAERGWDKIWDCGTLRFVLA